MIRRLHHINFLVRDLDTAVATYENVLGVSVVVRDQLHERGVITARFRVGDTWIVLVQPTRDDTIPARYLEEHGEGFFLMSFEVESLENELDRLGEGMFSGSVRSGVEGWRVVDLDSSTTFGAQLQFVKVK